MALRHPESLWLWNDACCKIIPHRERGGRCVKAHKALLSNLNIPPSKSWWFRNLMSTNSSALFTQQQMLPQFRFSVQILYGTLERVTIWNQRVNSMTLRRVARQQHVTCVSNLRWRNENHYSTAEKQIPYHFAGFLSKFIRLIVNVLEYIHARPAAKGYKNQ